MKNEVRDAGDPACPETLDADSITACALSFFKPNVGPSLRPRDCDASLMGGYYDQNEDSSCKRDDGVGRLLTVQRAACKVLL